MISTLAFELDDDADRNESGTSRYGEHLAHHQHLFRDGDAPTTDLAAFALMAWRVAGPPIMTPSYVRANPRVLSTATGWDVEDRAGLAVYLALPTSALMDRAAWRGLRWPRNRYASEWRDRIDNNRTTVLASLTVNIPIPREMLPDPRYRLGAPDADTAKGALRVLCALLNAELSGVLAELDAAEVAR